MWLVKGTAAKVASFSPFKIIFSLFDPVIQIEQSSGIS
jgi:hypothetical protein